MSRDSGGTFTLLVADKNPLDELTSADWNDLWNDIKTEMTDSLSRSGKGGMLAPLKLADGTRALPGSTFTAEVSSGWYRAGAGDVRLAVLDTDVLTATATLLTANVDLAATLSTASQPNVTSVGTLTALAVDNITIDGNDISTSSGNLTLTPVAGSAVVIDGGASFDGTVLTGLTALTSTAITGTLQTGAQPNITSVGLLGALTVVGNLTGPSGLWDLAGMNIAAGDAYFVDSNNVLTQIALGATVVNSSLTSLGTLSALDVTSSAANFIVDLAFSGLGGGTGFRAVSTSTTNSVGAVGEFSNDNASTGSRNALRLTQQSNGGFLDFRGLVGANTTSAISTLTTIGSVQRFVKVIIDGNTLWLAGYSDPS